MIGDWIVRRSVVVLCSNFSEVLRQFDLAIVEWNGRQVEIPPGNAVVERHCVNGQLHQHEQNRQNGWQFHMSIVRMAFRKRRNTSVILGHR